jgi:selenocysteine lyase/cysteine desulfurase
VGIGILYIKRKNICQLQPNLAGWKCVENNKNYNAYNLGNSCIRVAPHFYNMEEEIERFLDNVPMAPGRK